MRRDALLIEIGTEELPPKALKSLGLAFMEGIKDGLDHHQLAFSGIRWFASPRRLAIIAEDVIAQAEDKTLEIHGPPVSAARDKNGQWSKAAEGFARKNGVDPEQLLSIDTDKGPRLAVKQHVKGATVATAIETIVEEAINKLPIPKRMRWGASRAEFIRPVHWLVMLYGADILDAEIFGIKANNLTRGHRFHCDTTLAIANPSVYEHLLESNGHVIADYHKRQQKVQQQVIAAGEKLGGQAVIDPDLLDEVTSLVEWPVALSGSFEQRFLKVPAEALISSMKEHQKYFHVIDKAEALLPNFITVSNIESTDPAQVVDGNERVIRPRLSDAAFFFETDKKITLASRTERLKSIVFQEKLGTLFDKTVRVEKLAALIAGKIGGNAEQAGKAAFLAKADLVSEMVLEFDNMQGIAGYYYALNDGENEEVATAIKDQYLPKFAGDSLPANLTGCAVALADRLDTIVGIFGIGQPPTGSKDPFALRRASLGVLRILVEKGFDVDLRQLLLEAAQTYGAILKDPATTAEQVLRYMIERFRAWYEDDNIAVEVFMAVSAKNLSNPLDIHHRVHAVHQFSQIPESQALAAANKRVSNLLDKADITLPAIDEQLLTENAEKNLTKEVTAMTAKVMPLFNSGQYAEGLGLLAGLRNSVDAFFDEVMVMADDPAIKANRLALLRQLQNLFLEVADISLLVPSK